MIGIGFDQGWRTLLRELDKVATKGPWYSQEGKLYAEAPPLEEARLSRWDNVRHRYCIGEAGVGHSLDPIVAAELGWSPETDAANARLMAEARTAIPKMLAYIEELEREIHGCH